MSDINITQALLTWAIFIIAGTLHEWGHAYSAYRLGDNTAKDEGRLTVNPMVHIDPFGTVIFPFMLAYIGAPVFGWMRPVPYNPYNLRFIDRDSAYIAWAGPFMNFLQAAIMAVVTLVLYELSPEWLLASVFGVPVLALFEFFIIINLLLGFFNLIPVPPLDGGGILQYFLSDNGKARLYNIGRYGMIIAIGVVMFLQYPLFLIGPLRAAMLKSGSASYFVTGFILAGLVVNYIYFSKRIAVVTKSNKESRGKRATTGKIEGQIQTTEQNHRALFDRIEDQVGAREKETVLAELEKLQVADANICPAIEYKPKDEFCLQCEWYANCLKRKVQSEGSRPGQKMA